MQGTASIYWRFDLKSWVIITAAHNFYIHDNELEEATEAYFFLQRNGITQRLMCFKVVAFTIYSEFVWHDDCHLDGKDFALALVTPKDQNNAQLETLYHQRSEPL